MKINGLKTKKRKNANDNKRDVRKEEKQKLNST